MIDHLELVGDAAVPDLFDVGSLQLFSELGIAFKNLNDFL
jgi:hypothetical protein